MWNQVSQKNLVTRNYGQLKKDGKEESDNQTDGNDVNYGESLLKEHNRCM